MNKEEFNKLELIQQIEYINKGLENNSLNSVCEAIGISEATVRDRFKRKGYTRQGKEFISTGATPTIEPTKKELVYNIESNMKQYIKNNTTNTKNTKTQQKNNKASDIKALENRIESLEAQIKGIMDKINTNNTIDTTELKKYEGTTVSRSYRINEEVQKEFKKVCNRFTAGTEYTVTDIISLALEDFINKHKQKYN